MIKILVYPILLALLSYNTTSLAQSTGKNFLIEEETSELPDDLKPTDVIHWQAAGSESFPDGRIVVSLRLTTEHNFNLYKQKVTFKGPTGYKITEIETPQTKVITDPVTLKSVSVYREGEFKLTLLGPAPYQEKVFNMSVTYLGCTTRICLFPFTETLSFNNFYSKPQTTIKAEPSIGKATSNAASPEENYEDSLAKELEGGSKKSLLLLITIVFIGGLLTNLTPCVYPMIPITIRVLAHQDKSPLAASTAYASGILLIYTSLGVFAALTGSLFGNLMASPTFNFIFGLIMVFFGVNMLGFANFRFLQKIGSRLGTGKNSIKNAFMMGTGAGLVASPCTGPVLAALLAYTAKDKSISESVTLLFTYSFGFALPYVFFGGAAAKVAKIKVPPTVQVTIKIVFAAVMVGLGLYYLRIPAYSLLKTMPDYWGSITITTLIAGTILVIATYLNSSLSMNKKYQLAPMLFLGIGFFSTSEWIKTNIQKESSIVWIRSEQEALALQKKTGLPILLDAFAEWCEACKKMDATTFTDKKVLKKIQNGKWIPLKLDLTEPNDETDALIAKYKIKSLPTLILMRPKPYKPKYLLGYASSSKILIELESYLKD